MGSRLENNSSAVRKRIETHTFADEDGEEYSASSFGGFTDYMRRKKIKLQNLDAERRAQASGSDKAQIFRGMVCYVNGYTQPSLNDLHRLIVEHGGGFLQYLDGKTFVTHIIASNLTPKKREEFKRYRIVKPAWIVDSIKAGKLLPWDGYRLVDDGQKQKVLGFQDGKIVSQAGTQDQRRYREQTETSWYTGQVKAMAGNLNEPRPDQGQVDEPEISGLSTFDLVEDTSYQDDKREHTTHTSNDADQTAETDIVDAVETELGTTPKVDRTHLLPPEHDDLNSHSPKPDIPAHHPDGKPLTAEEHNAILLSDPKVWKSTVVNPGFLKQYYEESRLHHLSTWKAELKSQLQALALERSASQKARTKRPKGARRYVLHVDFDSFFVAVSMLKHPEYKDVPVVVAHGGGSGSEIASCNYPARKYGIKNGMWMKTAQELCAEIKVLPYDFKAYEDASRKFYAVIMDVGGVVQSVSIDEALVDVSNICIEAGGHDGRVNSEGSLFREQEKADELASQIRDEVKQQTNCAVSVGIGGNILQAKVALRRAKPAGQFQLRPDDVLEFIGALSVQDLPGVAYSIGSKLEDIGVKLVKDIREASKDKLISTLGPKTGEKLWEYSRGIDKAAVGEQVIRKSVSAEVNWGIRFATQEQAEEFMHNICEELEKRLSNEGVKGRQFSMKIMRRAKDAPLDPPKHLGHGKCDVFNKSVVLGVATNDKSILSREALSILRGFGFPAGELRGIGVQMTKLEPLKGNGILTESSQRLLSFGKAAHAAAITSPKPIARPSLRESSAASGLDSQAISDSTRKSVAVALRAESISPTSVPTPSRIPILRGEDELDSPQKTRPRPRADQMTPIGKNIEQAGFLNTTGTQFILPSQVDPSVMAELPEDIRSRFRRASEIEQKRGAGREVELRERSVSPSPASEGLPSQSQLDPETLAALPEDLRAEVLAQYTRAASPRPNRQGLLPQSPRKVRSLKIPTKRTAPTIKRGGLASRGRGGRASANAGFPTLTQANFVAIKANADNEAGEDASEEFLAALPADIRAEILEQQQRDRLRKRGGLDVLRRKKVAAPNAGAVKNSVKLERRVRPTFTSQKLSSLGELREATRLWYEELQDEEPAAEDVEALAAYLCKVVLEEQDMAKAVGVVKWLAWVVGEGTAEAMALWSAPVEQLKDRVQAAMFERGLGRVEF